MWGPAASARWSRTAIRTLACCRPAPIPGARPTRSPGRTSRAGSLLLEADLLERRRPRVRVDQHERGVFNPRPDRARPDVVVDGCEAHTLVEDLLDLA